MAQSIKGTKLKKQPEPDHIYPEYVYNLGSKALKTLLTIYNTFWNSRESLPDDWKKAIIILILKPGKPANLLSSYRPIALTSILAKLQERMILARINWYFENQNLLREEQAGFRQNRSTSYQLTKLVQDIATSFNRQESTLAVFIDFSGAYDFIWRSKLISKLNIEGNMLPWISRFLDQRWTKVKYSETFSKYKETSVGLPQGAVTSTTLLNTYINDLPSIIRNSINTTEKHKCIHILYSNDNGVTAETRVRD